MQRVVGPLSTFAGALALAAIVSCRGAGSPDLARPGAPRASASSTSPATASADVPAASSEAPKKKHAPLDGYAAYDARPDGAERLAAATKQADATHRRVLLVFGGDWCPWCRALDALFTSDAEIAKELAAHFVLVHVDADSNAAFAARYGDPLALGLPVLLVLDAKGTLLHTQETGALEKADGSVGHEPAKVLAFLRAWATAAP